MNSPIHDRNDRTTNNFAALQGPRDQRHNHTVFLGRCIRSLERLESAIGEFAQIPGATLTALIKYSYPFARPDRPFADLAPEFRDRIRALIATERVRPNARALKSDPLYDHIFRTLFRHLEEAGISTSSTGTSEEAHKRALIAWEQEYIGPRTKSVLGSAKGVGTAIREFLQMREGLRESAPGSCGAIDAVDRALLEMPLNLWSMPFLRTQPGKAGAVSLADLMTFERASRSIGEGGGLLPAVQALRGALNLTLAGSPPEPETEGVSPGLTQHRARLVSAVSELQAAMGRYPTDRETRDHLLSCYTFRLRPVVSQSQVSIDTTWTNGEKALLAKMLEQEKPTRPTLGSFFSGGRGGIVGGIGSTPARTLNHHERVALRWEFLASEVIPEANRFSRDQLDLELALRATYGMAAQGAKLGLITDDCFRSFKEATSPVLDALEVTIESELIVVSAIRASVLTVSEAFFRHRSEIESSLAAIGSALVEA